MPSYKLSLVQTVIPRMIKWLKSKLTCTQHPFALLLSTHLNLSLLAHMSFLLHLLLLFLMEFFHDPRFPKLSQKDDKSTKLLSNPKHDHFNKSICRTLLFMHIFSPRTWALYQSLLGYYLVDQNLPLIDPLQSYFAVSKPLPPLQLHRRHHLIAAKNKNIMSKQVMILKRTRK